MSTEILVRMSETPEPEASVLILLPTAMQAQWQVHMR